MAATFSAVPPIHPCDRCVIIPVTIFEDDLTERPFKTKDEQGNLKYGSVGSKTAYDKWFERQPEYWKQDYLGPTKYAMYKTGDLKFKDFANIRTNQILTIDQLTKKFDLDFEKFEKVTKVIKEDGGK